MPYTPSITVTPFDPRLGVGGMSTAPYVVPGLPVPPAAPTTPVAPTMPAMPSAAVPRAPAGAPSYADLRNQVAKMYTGLLNRQDAGYTADPLATGLLNMGATLSQYGAPSMTPKGGFMGAIGAGGQGFIGGYQAAADARRKAEMALLGNKLAAAKALMDAQKDEAGQIVGSAETGFYRVGLDGAVTPVVAGVGRKPSAITEKIIAEGLDPNSPEGQARARELNNNAGMKIDMGIDPNRAMQAEVNKTEWTTAHDNATASSRSLQALSQAEELMNAGMKSGVMQQGTMMPRQIASALFGREVNTDLAMQEAMTSLENKLALSQHRPGMGPMTDPDFERYRAISPNLRNSDVGNRLVIQRMRHELTGDVYYREEVRRQIAAGEMVDPAKAWEAVQNRLGSMIPNISTKLSIDEWAKTPEAASLVGKVIVLNGKAQYVGR